MSKVISFIKKAFDEGTNIERYNILAAAFIGPFAHISLWILYTYFFPMQFENLYFRLFLAFLCVMSYSHEFLSDKIRTKYFPFYWHFMVMMELPFQCTFLMLMNNFHHSYLYWEIFCVITMIIYTPHWFAATANLLIATILAIVCYYIYAPEPNLLKILLGFDYIGYFLVFSFATFSSMAFIHTNRTTWLARQQKQHQRLTSIAGSIAHELRNPINAIMLSTETLSDNEENLSFKKQTRKITSLANEIINMTLQQLSGKEVDKKDFECLSAKSIIIEALLIYGYKSEAEKLKVVANFGQAIFQANTIDKLETQIGSDALSTGEFHGDFLFKGEETTCKYILFNLIKNALFYLAQYPDSIVEVGIKENLIVKDERGISHRYNSIYVSDTGPGISEENISKLFGDFYTSGKKEGTGLGLAFCKRNMKAFGGDIICESELGKWTKFSLLFPILEPEELTKIKTVEQSDSALPAVANDVKANLKKPLISVNKDAGKFKILIVDDEKTNLLITKSMIEKNLDILCELAHDGDEAAEIERHHVEDHSLVLTDIQMPAMNGIIAARNIRSFNKKIPIIALTSLEYEDLKKDDHNYFNDHLNKPIVGHILYRTVAKLIPTLVDDMDYLGDAEQYLPDIKAKKILIADDQELNLSIFARKLQKLGMEVIQARDGKELLNHYVDSLQNIDNVTKSSFDIIVTDVNMPLLSGVEATEEIRNLEIKHAISYRKRIPIIALSGDGEIEDLMSFLRVGMTDYFVKGSDIEKLIKLLVIYLNPNKHYKSLHHKKEDEILHHKMTNKIDVSGSELKVINQEKLEQFGEDDRKEFLQVFLKGCENQINKINDSFRNKNEEEFLLAMHALKGISGNIGAERMFDLVSRIAYSVSNKVEIEGDYIQDLQEKLEEVKILIAKL